eukprot:TRINITY_DN1039_c0_g2_i5.p1 TRINITY_DN1039_c0_g2~~TRINITY_DN1039_c0_g2_i5.p1  ORF type:complete len:581 (+),score=122.42 TRINITY_DN1039_c0_g2_i5:120-1862(+)
MSSEAPSDLNSSEYGSQYLSSLQQKFVTAQDFAQFQRFFNVLEEKAKRAVAIKSKQVHDLQVELEGVSRTLDQLNKQHNHTLSMIQAAKGKLRQYGAEAPSDDLLELIDGYYQFYSNQLRHRLEENRKLEARIGELDLEKKEWKTQCDQLKYKLDEVKQLLYASGMARPRSLNVDVTELLGERLAISNAETKEKDIHISTLTSKLGELQLTVDEKNRALDRMQGEKKDVSEKLQTAREILYTSQVPSRMVYTSPLLRDTVIETDLIALMTSREQDILDELVARDRDSAEMKRRIKELEDSLMTRTSEIDRSRREINQLSSERNSKAIQLDALNEQLSSHSNIIRRQTEELEERRLQIDRLGRELKLLSEDFDDKVNQLEQTEEEMRLREEQIATLQRKLKMAQEEVGEKVVVLSLLLDKVKHGREEFDDINQELDQLSDRLDKILQERLEMETSLRRLRDDESILIQENKDALSRDFEFGDFSRNYGPGNLPTSDGVVEDDELGNLFSAARRSLLVLGEKATYSFAALKAKDDLDAVYNEQLTVTGVEMMLRDKKTNLLMAKVPRSTYPFSYLSIHYLVP